MRFENNDKWGFLDLDCKIKIKPVYDYVYDFQNDYAKVQKGKFWTFIDKDGNEIKKAIFKNVEEF